MILVSNIIMLYFVIIVIELHFIHFNERVYRILLGR